MRRITLTGPKHSGRTAAATIVVGVLSVAILAPGASGSPAARTSKTVTIGTAKNTRLGTILESGGRTLYVLNKTACPSACLGYWPPVLLPSGVSKATAGAGVNAAKLGKAKDVKGAWQVTYGGKALFWFVEDTAAGQVKGNNLTDPWGLWTVIVTAKPKPSGSASTTTTEPKTTTTTKPSTTTTNPGTGGGGGVSF